MSAVHQLPLASGGARRDADAVQTSHKVSAPAAIRTVVKLAASMLAEPKAKRHKIEFAANATSATSVRAAVRVVMRIEVVEGDIGSRRNLRSPRKRSKRAAR
jgi:hypothetical protein